MRKRTKEKANLLMKSVGRKIPKTRRGKTERAGEGKNRIWLGRGDPGEAKKRSKKRPAMESNSGLSTNTSWVGGGIARLISRKKTWQTKRECPKGEMSPFNGTARNLFRSE